MTSPELHLGEDEHYSNSEQSDSKRGEKAHVCSGNFCITTPGKMGNEFVMLRSLRFLSIIYILFLA